MQILPSGKTKTASASFIRAKNAPASAAGALVTSFRQFIEDNKDEIEAISILYSHPYVAGLRYSQIKDLARRLSIKSFPSTSPNRKRC